MPPVTYHSGIPDMANPRPEDFAKALERYLPDTQSIRGKEPEVQNGPIDTPGTERLPIQASVDLHGQTLEEACRSVDRFLKASAGQGLRKVLIIHGKGAGILRLGISRFLEGHPLAGKRQPAPRDAGGTGALIVLIRQK